jgi:hypothetical protein
MILTPKIKKQQREHILNICRGRGLNFISLDIPNKVYNDNDLPKLLAEVKSENLDILNCKIVFRDFEDFARPINLIDFKDTDREKRV